MKINISWDASVDSAPAGYKAAVEAAVAYLEKLLVNPITVNISFGWGQLGKDPMQADIGDSLSSGLLLSYAELREWLGGAANSADDLAALMALATRDPTQDGTFFVPSAMAKALGLLPPNDAGLDGYVALDPDTAFTFDPNNRAVPGLQDAIGVLLNEITEVLGRVAFAGVQWDDMSLYGPQDLFRYSAPGVHAFSGPGYFSVDGQTLLTPFNFSGKGDIDDWAAVVGDAFSGIPQEGVLNGLSATDLRVLDLLGYRLAAGPAPITPDPQVPATSVRFTVHADTTFDAATALHFANSFSADPSAFGSVLIDGYYTFTNNGSITDTADPYYTYGVKAVAVRVPYQTLDTAVSIVNNGTIYAHDRGSRVGDAWGVIVYGRTNIQNSGLIQVVADNGMAWGIAANDSLVHFTNLNSGILRVWGAEYAVGLGSVYDINNAGLIEVSGGTADQAVIAIFNPGQVNNSGTIRVSPHNGGPAYGIFWGTGSSIQVNNSGVIEAQYAIYQSAYSTYWAPLDLVNSGRISGSIVLGDAAHQIRNTGVIAGDIFMGTGGVYYGAGAMYDGRGGQLLGGLFLGAAANTVWLGDRGEVVYGGGKGDTITGGAGDDRINLWAGNNVVDGGGGFNTLSFAQAAGAVTVDLKAGTATGAGTTTIRNIQRVDGGDFNDILYAAVGGSELAGAFGNDVLVGRAGDDKLFGGAGDDRLEGGAGADRLDGGDGLDEVRYASAATGVTVNLATGVHTGDAAGDTFVSIERFVLSGFNDSFTGAADRDWVIGGAGNDVLFGAGGDDVLEGGAGADRLDGGAGIDEASYANAAAAVSLNLTSGVHTGEANGDTFVSIERYGLSRYGDQFTGSAGADDVAGAGGNDILFGAAGDDVLDGGAGNDILRGGLGADRLIGGDGTDQANYQLATAAVSINLTTGVHTGEAAGDTFESIERFVLTGYGDQFTGSAGADEAVGYYGNDILFGAGGDDKLDGGNGNDILRGGEGADQLIGGTGTDTASYQIATAAVTLNLTTGVHTGEAAGDTFDSIERYALSTLNDSFIGSAGADWVDGWKGNDVLYGQGGADEMFGNEGNDQLYGGTGNDKLHGDGGADILYGDAGSDILYGGTGADQLFGGDDGDYLWGEAGNDVLTGGAGADRFAFSYGSGVDIITDFQRGQDKIILKGMVGIDDFSDLRISADIHGWAVITWGDGTSSVTLNGIAAGQVTASDIWFT